MNTMSDPNVFGPGMWMTLHILSYNANTLSQSKNFLYVLKPIIEKIPCKKCRIHALTFIKNKDYNIYIHEKSRSGTYIGPFMYVCDMHNNANILLDKSIMNWKEAYQLYDNLEKGCSEGPCMDDHIIDHQYEKIKSNIIESIDPPISKVIFTKKGKIVNT
jgi:hypothetical protein